MDTGIVVLNYDVVKVSSTYDDVSRTYDTISQTYRDTVKILGDSIYSPGFWTAYTFLILGLSSELSYSPYREFKLSWFFTNSDTLLKYDYGAVSERNATFIQNIGLLKFIYDDYRGHNGWGSAKSLKLIDYNGTLKF
jgi:hypothetical protein